MANCYYKYIFNCKVTIFESISGFLIIRGPYLPINSIGFGSDLVAFSNLAFLTNKRVTFTLFICRDISRCKLIALTKGTTCR